MVCCSVCFVSQMRSLMNISPRPMEHHSSLSACVHPQPLHPALKKLSFLLLGSAPLRGGLFPLFFPERQARPCHRCWGTTALRGCMVLGLATSRLCLLELPVPRLVRQPEDMGSEGQGLDMVFRHLQRSVPPASSADFQFVPIWSADQ